MNFSWEMTKQVIASIIRGALYVIASWLVARGWIDQDLADAWLSEATGIVLGILILVIPIIWKYLHARFHILALAKAVQTAPTVNTPAEVEAAVADVKAEVKAENTAVVSV